MVFIERLEPRRLLAAGGLDTSFSGDGQQIIDLTSAINTPESPTDIIVYPDGKILFCYSYQTSGTTDAFGLVQLTGELDLGGIDQSLIQTLSEAGFLEDEKFAGMQDLRHREFAASPLREPAHAGSAYPADAGEMRDTMTEYMSGASASSNGDGGSHRGSPRK